MVPVKNDATDHGASEDDANQHAPEDGSNSGPTGIFGTSSASGIPEASDDCDVSGVSGISGASGVSDVLEISGVSGNFGTSGTTDGAQSDNAETQRANSSWAQAPGTILLAATPIGNSDDASPRFLQALRDADIIGAEDTRRLFNLARRLGIYVRGQVIALHDHNEHQRAADMVVRAQEGARILIVSDAGMPTVSDPGYRVTSAAIEAGVPVSALPGPSAPVTALAVSGLPTDRFTFEGFIPRKEGEAVRYLNDLADESRTMIFFESPRRLGITLQHMADIFGEERRGVVCRELTKSHEDIWRASLGELSRRASETEVLGEITVVVAGARLKADAKDYARLVLALADEEGIRLKDAARQIAQETGARANDLYREALGLRSGSA